MAEIKSGGDIMGRFKNVVITMTILLVTSCIGQWGYLNDGLSQVNAKLGTKETTSKDSVGIFKLNKDYRRRDRILKIHVNWDTGKGGGITCCKHIDLPILTILLKENFINPEDRQNNAPSVIEIYRFMVKYPQVIAFGYAVSPRRDDYRISIEGIYVPANKVTEKMKKDFIKFCKDPDEIETDNDLYAWWD
jgi:hypothetical protein